MQTRMKLVSVIIGLFLLAACTPSQPKPLKIVASVPKEVDFGIQMGNAIQMAFDEVGSKIGDIPLELTIYDGGLSDNKEIATLNSLKDDPQFVLYLGAFTSGFARDVIPLTNPLHLPVISSAATWPGLTKTGYGVGEPGIYYPSGERTFFRVVPADDIQGKVAVQFIRDQGYQSIYVINADDAYAEGLVNLLLANAENDNIPIVGRSHFDVNKVTDDEIKTIVTAVEAAKPDAVYFSVVYGTRTTDMLKALKAANQERPIIGSDGLVGGINIQDISSPLPNVYATVFKIDSDQTPELTTFAKKYQEKYKSGPGDYVLTATAYEAAKVALDAISRAGSTPTRETVLKALHETKDYKGVLGTWSFDDKGDTSYDVFTLLTVENGAWVPFKNASK